MAYGDQGSADQRDSCTFKCTACRITFSSRPDLIKDADDGGAHPWKYFATCPSCGAEQQPQIAWERNLLKAWSSATGPKTAAGISAVTRNIAGHPTADETARTRFNAMKHGLYARVARFFPARPGKYPECESCPHLSTLHCLEVNACLAKAEIFIRYQGAAASGDPASLMELWADNQASLQAIINQMILLIALDGGPRIKTPDWYYDRDGDFHLAKYQDEMMRDVQLYKLSAHPLLKPLIELLSKNHMTLADMELTPRVREENELMRGHLQKSESTAQSTADFQAAQLLQVEALREMLGRSQQATKADPVLLEYKGADTDG